MISTSTVRKHVEAVRTALGVRSRVELLAKLYGPERGSGGRVE